MRDYLSESKEWVEDAPDLSAEMLEAAIERLGYRIVDAVDMPVEQRSNIDSAISFLNEKLASMTGEVRGQVASEGQQSASPSSGDLDFSPLIPESNVVEDISDEQREKNLSALLASGLVSKGIDTR